MRNGESEKHRQAEAVATEAWNVYAEEFVCCCLYQLVSALSHKASDSLLFVLISWIAKNKGEL